MRECKMADKNYGLDENEIDLLLLMKSICCFSSIDCIMPGKY
jgi:hypothetical protein